MDISRQLSKRLPTGTFLFSHNFPENSVPENFNPDFTTSIATATKQGNPNGSGAYVRHQLRDRDVHRHDVLQRALLPGDPRSGVVGGGGVHPVPDLHLRVTCAGGQNLPSST